MVDYNLGIGTTGLRKEVVDAAVKQVAARSFKFKQAVTINSTGAWKNTFYREDLSISSGPIGNKFEGIPRGANFPNGTTKWEEVSVRIIKFGSQANIPWEDDISNEINVMARSIIRRTEEVVKAVDDYIWGELTQDRTLTGVIQSFAIGGGNGRGGHWDETSAAIVDNLLEASELIATNGNYDTSDLICFISPKDHRSIMNYVADKGAQWQGPATTVLINGDIGKVGGVRLIEATSVTASYALVVKPRTCATYKELVSLRSTVIDDPYRSKTIRIVAEGAIELTDPLAIVLIGGTQKA